MTVALAIGSVGWGLIGVGAVTHLRHPDHLADLLRVHTRHAHVASRALIGVELTVAVGAAVGVLGGLTTLRQVSALAGALLGIGFAVWVLRLLVSGSELPCACSWSSAPTTIWSLGRAIAVISVGFLALAGEPGVATSVAALVIGASMGAAGFLVPDAVAWPEESVRLRELANGEAA